MADRNMQLAIHNSPGAPKETGLEKRIVNQQIEIRKSAN